MSIVESTKTAAGALANSPNAGLTISAGTAVLGAASWLDVIHGGIASASMTIGFLTTVVILIWWGIRVAKEWLELKAWIKTQKDKQ